MHTNIVQADPENFDIKIIREAASILKNGGIVAFPTETVYGLAADYNNPEAIDKLYNIKQRPKNKPFAIFLARKQDIAQYVNSLTRTAAALMDNFWPGPLTLIVAAKDGQSLGFRMPANKLAQNIVNESTIALAVSSANLAGGQEPKDALDLIKTFDSKIEMIINAGPTSEGIPSTVVDARNEQAVILREGAKANQIKELINKNKKIKNILAVCAGNSCRSPMAEGLLKKELGVLGFNIKSAGIIAVDGLPPSEEMTQVMERYANVDMSDFVTHHFDESLAEWADVILVMDKSQKNFISGTMPGAASKTYLLKEFANIKTDNLNVADPIGKSYSAYEDVYNQIQEAVQKISRKLKEQ